VSLNLEDDDDDDDDDKLDVSGGDGDTSNEVDDAEKMLISSEGSSALTYVIYALLFDITAFL